MTDHYILDAQGEPHPCDDWLVWARWLETADRVLAQTRFPDHPFPPTDEQIGRYTSPLPFAPCRELEHAVTQMDLSILVSTVFLGLDHRFGGDEDGPPVLWESMIFGGPLSGEMRRYTSRADALAGHEALCELVRLEIAAARATATDGEG